MYSHFLDNISREAWSNRIFSNERDVEATEASVEAQVRYASSRPGVMTDLSNYKGRNSAERENYISSANKLVQAGMKAFYEKEGFTLTPDASQPGGYRIEGNNSESMRLAAQQAEDAQYAALGMERKIKYDKSGKKTQSENVWDKGVNPTLKEHAEYVTKEINRATELEHLFGQKYDFGSLGDQSINLLYSDREALKKYIAKNQNASMSDLLSYIYGRSIKSQDSNTQLASTLKSLFTEEGKTYTDSQELRKLFGVNELKDALNQDGSKTPFLKALQERAELLGTTIEEIIDNLDTLGMIDGNGVLNSTFANVEASFNTLSSAIDQLNSQGRIDAQTLDSLFENYSELMGKFFAEFEGSEINATNLIKYLQNSSQYQVQQDNAVGKNYILSNQTWFDQRYKNNSQ